MYFVRMIQIHIYIDLQECVIMWSAVFIIGCCSEVLYALKVLIVAKHYANLCAFPKYTCSLLVLLISAGIPVATCTW